MVNIKADLILEGGGVRCAFTLGLIDYFLDNDIYFENIYGVSAGSIVGAVFLARNRDLKDSLIRIIKNNSKEKQRNNKLIDLVSTYKSFLSNYYSFDFQTFKNSKSKLYSVLLNAQTGQSEYISSNLIEDLDDLSRVIAGSCAVPMFAEEVSFKGSVYYDGGFSDPIPVFKSFNDRKNKKVVVLTRDIDYRKSYEPIKTDISEIVPYPNVIFSSNSRYKSYNEAKEFSLYMEKNNDCICFMPEKEVNMSFEHLDFEKMEELYFDGYKQGQNNFKRLLMLND